VADTAVNPYSHLSRQIRSQFTTAYAQVQLVFILKIPASEENGLAKDIEKIMLVISPVKIEKVEKIIGYRAVTKGEFHPDEFIDADAVVANAGRVVRRQHTSDATFVSRPGSQSYFGLEYD
jgi:hypothetical protein